MSNGFGGTPKRNTRVRRSLPASIVLAGAVAVLVAALMAPLVGSLLDSSVKGESAVSSFILREFTNLLAAVVAIAVLVLLTRIRDLRLTALSTLAFVSAIVVVTFTLSRFALQVTVGLLDLSQRPQWVGPEVLWALMLWPFLCTVLALVAQRERIVDAQLVLIDEARRALQDDHEALRSRVFDHLHGTVTSELVVARVRLNDLAEEIPDPEIAKRVSVVASNLQRLHELEVRRLAHVMVASGLDTSLDEALHQLAASCEGLSEVTVTIAPAYGSIDAALDSDARATLRLTIYRIVEECISNALQHAQAEHIDVTVDALADGRGRMIAITTINDGDVSNEATRPGAGLSVIKARISAYEGSLTTAVVDSRFVVSATMHAPA